VKATFFVTVGWTGVAQDYMSWEQLAELIALGHCVQTHGWSHRFLTSCAGAELEEELRRPRLALEDRLGVAVDSLSFPGGRWNRRVLEACRSAGYTAAFTSDPWPLEREVGGMRLVGRVGVTRSTTPARLLRLREDGGRPGLPERLRHGATRALQGLLGDALYHRLWCLWAGWDPELEGRLIPRRPDS
jgi:peptidoglycan/xylan/chitin deacetylase (PgdA/CDA1 family)